MLKEFTNITKRKIDALFKKNGSLHYDELDELLEIISDNENYGDAMEYCMSTGHLPGKNPEKDGYYTNGTTIDKRYTDEEKRIAAIIFDYYNHNNGIQQTFEEFSSYLNEKRSL